MTKVTLFLSVFFVSLMSIGHEHPAANPLKAHLPYKNNSLHLHTELNAEPKIGIESYLKIETRRGKDHSLVSISDTIEVELWMPDMGHGSAPTQVTRTIDANGNAVTGSYLVRNLYFIMGGAWEVRIALTDSSGNKEIKNFTVMVGGGHQH